MNRPAAGSALLLFLLLGGCTTPAPLPDAAGSVLTGDWGGRGAALTLDTAGGRIEHDCAHGMLDAPLRPDASGAFRVQGRHVREHGGPVRIDQPEQAQPAVYSGRATGGRMQLRVDIAGGGFGPFDLQRGQPAQLVKCL